MYNESVAIPMMVSGPGIPGGKVSRTPVSLVDVYPTVLQNAGLSCAPEKPGRSLIDIANLPDDESRPVFSEYHATAAKSAEFMIRRGRYKYIYYVGFDPELYDLQSDPEELKNLALDPAYAGLLKEFEQSLCEKLDPDQVDQAAKADQGVLIELLGGREIVSTTLSPAATPAPKN